MIKATNYQVFGADESKSPLKYGKCVRRERRLGRILSAAEESEEQALLLRQIEKTRNRIDQLSSVGQYRRRRFRNQMIVEDAAEEDEAAENMHYYSAKSSRSSKLKGGFDEYAPLISHSLSERIPDALNNATEYYAQKVITAIFGDDQREIKYPVVKERDGNHMMNMFLDRYEQDVSNEN